MKHVRFELDSAQTLRLQELRQILAETLPADQDPTTAYPVAHFAVEGCWGCFWSCSGGCTGSCHGGCTGSCNGSCWPGCRGCLGCMGSCVHVLY
jgi:hypothetical protein